MRGQDAHGNNTMHDLQGHNHRQIGNWNAKTCLTMSSKDSSKAHCGGSSSRGLHPCSIPIHLFSATLAEMRLNRTFMERSITLSVLGYPAAVAAPRQIKSSDYKPANSAAECSDEKNVKHKKSDKSMYSSAPTLRALPLAGA